MIHDGHSCSNTRPFLLKSVSHLAPHWPQQKGFSSDSVACVLMWSFMWPLKLLLHTCKYGYFRILSKLCKLWGDGSNTIKSTCANLTLVHLLSLVKGQNVSLQGVRSGISFLTQVALELLYCGNKKTLNMMILLILPCYFHAALRGSLGCHWRWTGRRSQNMSMACPWDCYLS